MEENPFPGLKITNCDFLERLEDRQQCSNCKKSRKYYCYTCFKPLTSLVDRIPQIKLPFNVDIIKHPGEVCGKSTAIHAAVLAPEFVTIYVYPNIPAYQNNSRVVLIYPGADAKTLEDYVDHLKENPLKHVETTVGTSQDETVQPTSHIQDCSKIPQIDTVVFIDSTWFQVNRISSDERLSALQRIVITTYETKFWRYQLDKPATYLSTIEAIYYCTKEYHERFICTPYEGQYDDLLFFFCFFYQKIRITTLKSGKTLKSYPHQRKKDACKE